MIKDGFLYLAALIFAAAVLVNLPKIFKGKKAQVFFNFAPPIVLIYLGLARVLFMNYIMIEDVVLYFIKGIFWKMIQILKVMHIYGTILDK